VGDVDVGTMYKNEFTHPLSPHGLHWMRNMQAKLRQKTSRSKSPDHLRGLQLARMQAVVSSAGM